jgi:hypothetical protein
MSQCNEIIIRSIPLIYEEQLIFSIFIARAQASDTGYYTCELINGRDAMLRRSFDLRVKGKRIHGMLSSYCSINSMYIFRAEC